METKQSQVAAHTPGPWHVGEDGDVFCDGACIAKVCGAPEGIEEDKANAYLIAAAPRLLKAAGAALSWWHSKPSNFYEKEPAWLPLIRAAIAEAEGE